jgi:hypothetical protein
MNLINGINIVLLKKIINFKKFILHHHRNKISIKSQIPTNTIRVSAPLNTVNLEAIQNNKRLRIHLINEIAIVHGFIR